VRTADSITSGVHVAHPATSYEDRPHVAPVWYALDDGTVESVTTGAKLESIRHNPRVALSVPAMRRATPSGV